jgi:hypothetical protein
MRFMAVAVLIATVGCQKSAPVQPKAQVAQEPVPSFGATELAKPVANPSGRWHVQKLKTKAEVTEDQKLPALDEAALSARLTETVAKMPQVLGLGEPPETVPVEQRVGVQLTMAWQVMDLEGKAQPAQHPPVDGNLVLTVTAHAEQASLKGDREVAERTIDATVPLPAERELGLAPFVVTRLQQASEQAVSDVLGELWARGLEDPAILTLLDDDAPWRKMAGAREVGERGLKAGRDRLEKAARDSRKDIAAVAAAALGRLADPHSVPVLTRLLAAIHPEVLDAAMVSLVDIGTPEALAAVQKLSEEHENPDIRQRATGLLQERAARRPGK